MRHSWEIEAGIIIEKTISDDVNQTAWKADLSDPLEDVGLGLSGRSEAR